MENSVQIKNLFADQRIICRLKIYPQIEELFANQRTIKNYLMFFDLWIQELSADQRTICRLNKYV